MPLPVTAASIHTMSYWTSVISKVKIARRVVDCFTPKGKEHRALQDMALMMRRFTTAVEESFRPRVCHFYFADLAVVFIMNKHPDPLERNLRLDLLREIFIGPVDGTNEITGMPEPHGEEVLLRLALERASKSSPTD